MAYEEEPQDSSRGVTKEENLRNGDSIGSRRSKDDGGTNHPLRRHRSEPARPTRDGWLGYIFGSTDSDSEDGSSSSSDTSESGDIQHLQHLQRHLSAPARTQTWDDFEVGSLKHPADVKRRCTDVSWLVAFAILLLALLAVGFSKPSYSALLKLADYDGQVCGTVGSDAPFAYVCAVDVGENKTAFTVCRESCPSTDHSKLRCINHEMGVDVEAQDYPTQKSLLYLSNLCVPQSVELANHLFVHHARAAGEARLAVAVKSLWVPLLIAALVTYWLKTQL